MKIFLILVISCLLLLINGQNLRGKLNEESDVAIETETETVISNVRRRLQTQFNRFRSYQNAKVKPNSYSARSRKHAVSEYLSPVQKYMVANQQRDVPSNMFNNNWSGFDKNQ